MAEREVTSLLSPGSGVPVVDQPSTTYNMTVLETKTSYLYTIPSFSAITLKLKHIYVRTDEEDGVFFFDVFFHEYPRCSRLEVTHPRLARITNGCLIELEEFQRGLSEELSYEDWQLLPGLKVFVAYTWNWCDDYNGSDEHEDEDPAESSQSEDEDEPDPFDNGFTTHTVTFKCIGATRDDSHQEALQAAAKDIKEGKDVPVRLQLEPDNPVDSDAIAFQCHVHSVWKRVGYVVQEVLAEVHDAMKKHEIISVKFSWVKFRLCWSRCGPGFYAGVNISKKGSWSRACLHCASTR